jgi:hypothetical protein
MQLTGSGLKRAMRPAVDKHTARPADPFPTVMIKSDWFLTFQDKVIIEDIEHFKK